MSALAETQLLGSKSESTLRMSAVNDNSGSTLASDPEKRRHHIHWKRRTKLERRLCLVTVVSLLLVFVLAIALSVIGYRLQKKQDTRQTTSHNSDGIWSHSITASDFCLTPECVEAASEILSHLDKTVHPCEDFYRFACGGWMERQKIPNDKSEIHLFNEIGDKVDLKLKDLLEKELPASEPSLVRTTLLGFYTTCMDLDSVEKAGARPLKRVLKNLGGWPVVEGDLWNESAFDWVDCLISLRRIGYSHDILLSMSVTIDARNNTVYTIQLDQTSLGMPDRSYLLRGLEDPTTAAYFRQMVRAARLLGASEDAETELRQALNFEITLAKYSWPKEERKDVNKLYNKYTLRNLQDLMPQVPWLKYFNGLLNDEINEEESLIVAVPNFVIKFANLIFSTEKRVVANYMMWRVVRSSLPLMSKEWRDIDQEYNSVLSGASREKPRWKQCLSEVQAHLGIALSAYYVRNHSQKESREAASTYAQYIHREFLDILEKKDWMNESTRKQAKAKVNAMKFFVGYPKELLNDTALMEVYETLKITNGGYFENVLRLHKWSTDKVLSRLRKTRVRQDWKDYGSRVTSVDAFYRSHENYVEIPLGILQGHFFSNDRPHYLNFGAIGFIIGHEITHGFDDEGRHYDKDGNNVNWWDRSTNEHFKKKAQCVIDQYSNYTAENGMKVNGMNTLGENIADIGGLKEAYWAYQSWTKEKGPDPMLPGLKFVPNQLFWISAAHVWCAKIRPETLKRRILSDSHSPPQFRVVGPVSNLAEFARDFSCSPKSSMNKGHKCEVW